MQKLTNLSICEYFSIRLFELALEDFLIVTIILNFAVGTSLNLVYLITYGTSFVGGLGPCHHVLVIVFHVEVPLRVSKLIEFITFIHFAD